MKTDTGKGHFTGERVIVFVKVADAHVRKVGELLGGIDQEDYFFCILPLETEFLSREQVEQLMREVPSGQGN